MRILIVGAGPAGLTLAAGLLRQGIVPTVIERAAGPRTGGYVINIQANGWDVAARLGVLDALQARAMPAADSVYRHASGRELFRFRHRIAHEITEGKLLYMPRDTLVGVLAEHVLGHIPIRFGVGLERIETMDDGAAATFTDGAQERFDLVVGADGIHSRVRELAFGPEAQFLKPLGYRAAAWRMPWHGTASPMFEGYMDVGRQAILYASGPREIAALLCWRSDETAPVPAEMRHGVLERAFDDAAPAVRRLLGGPVDWSAAFLDTVCQIEMPRWSMRCVALIGDAACCMSFLSGQGTSMAMAGAFILAEELGRGTIDEAFARYEARLRPTIEEVQRNARRTARAYLPETPFGLQLRTLLMPLAMSRLALRLRARALVAPSLV